MQFTGRIDSVAPSSPDPPAPPLKGDESAWLAERWRRLGERFLDDVRGDFALVLFDPESGLVAAARDGFGNRYLACRIDSDGVEIGQLDADLAREGARIEDLEPTRLAEFYAFADLSGPSTFLRGVQALLPGELLIHRGTEARRHALPGPDLELRIWLHSWEEYVEQFASLLTAAVRRALRDAEGAAIWLSGGLDSTPIAALAARELERRTGTTGLDALAWRMRDREADESAYIAPSAAACGARLSWIECDDALPFSDLSNWPIHPSTPEQTPYRWLHERSYARAAELGRTVVLNGFNGDLLYGHARRWFWTLLASAGAGAAIDRLRELSSRVGPWAAVRGTLIGPLLPKRRGLRRTLPGYLTPDARAILESLPRYPPHAGRARRPRQAERLMALMDAHGDGLERWFAARYGVEPRSPLRDRDLVQFALAVPDHVLQQGTETRPVLREAIRGLVPENVRIRRDKGRFRDVLDRGLAPSHLPWARRLLFDRDALWRPYVRETEVARWLDGDLTTEWDRLGFLQCLNGELWRLKRAGVDLASVAAK